MGDTLAHLFRSFLPCTAAQASSATAHRAPHPPHRQAGDLLQALLFRGAHACPPGPAGAGASAAAAAAACAAACAYACACAACAACPTGSKSRRAAPE